MSKKFQHEWSFMGSPTSKGLGDLNYCSLCNRWQQDGHRSGKPFKMSNSEFMEWHISGRIDASASLGTIEEAKAEYKRRYDWNEQA